MIPHTVWVACRRCLDGGQARLIVDVALLASRTWSNPNG